MKVEWIEYKGKKILYTEYSGAKTDKELIDTLHKQVDILTKITGKTLSLVNIANTNAGPDYMAELKKYGKDIKKQKIEKTATLGITGIKKVLFTAYIAFTGEVNKAFDSEAEAKEWLIKQNCNQK